MKPIYLLVACLFFGVAGLSQQITISVSNLRTEVARISALTGEKEQLIDSVTGSKGDFTFWFTPKNHPGLYRVSFGGSKRLDFVHDGEAIEITSDANALVESLRVVKSESNHLFYSFRRLNHQYKTKSELLQLILARYPKDDPYYATTQAAFVKLQSEYLEFIRSARKPTAFVDRYIRSAQLATVNSNDPVPYLKAHALDHVDFADEGLVHSDLFTTKSIEYLTYYRNPQLPKELLEKEFMVAVDTILNMAKVNQVVYKHITEYLIDGFRQFGFEECISYILDNYVIKDDICLDWSSGSTIQRMIDQKRFLAIGSTAPEITLPDTLGRPVSLATMKKEKVLLVFYSTTCPHCKTMVPRLFRGVRNNRNVVVLAISLDSKLDDWLAFTRTHALAWTNVIDMQGWGGKTASDYFIYATPTMILVDKERKIIAKPMTIEELQKLL